MLVVTQLECPQEAWLALISGVYSSSRRITALPDLLSPSRTPGLCFFLSHHNVIEVFYVTKFQVNISYASFYLILRAMLCGIIFYLDIRKLKFIENQYCAQIHVHTDQVEI